MGLEDGLHECMGAQDWCMDGTGMQDVSHLTRHLPQGGRDRLLAPPPAFTEAPGRQEAAGADQTVGPNDVPCGPGRLV